MGFNSRRERHSKSMAYTRGGLSRSALCKRGASTHEDGDTPDAFAMPCVLQCVAPSGFVSSGARHDRLDAVVANLAWRTAPWLVVETVETVPCEPLAPAAHGLPGDADGIRNLAVVETIGRPQYAI